MGEVIYGRPLERLLIEAIFDPILTFLGSFKTITYLFLFISLLWNSNPGSHPKAKIVQITTIIAFRAVEITQIVLAKIFFIRIVWLSVSFSWLNHWTFFKDWKYLIKLFWNKLLNKTQHCIISIYSSFEVISRNQLEQCVVYSVKNIFVILTLIQSNTTTQIIPKIVSLTLIDSIFRMTSIHFPRIPKYKQNNCK